MPFFNMQKIKLFRDKLESIYAGSYSYFVMANLMLLSNGNIIRDDLKLLAGDYI